MRKLLLYLSLALALLISGCGYHLSENRPLPSAITGKKFSIPVLVNKSYRANIGAILADSLVDEFALRTGGKVVPEDSADLILNGTVLTYTSTAVSYTAADKVREYRAVITVEPVLTEKETHRVIWKGVLSWGQDYPTNTNVALQQDNEQAAIREICRKLSQQIYQKISDGF